MHERSVTQPFAMPLLPKPQTRLSLTSLPPAPLLVCFSHLRWDFVWQRPQHLMTRAARHFRVLVIEEPVFRQGATAHIELSRRPPGVTVAVPVLPEGLDADDIILEQRELVETLIGRRAIPDAGLLVLHADGACVFEPSRLRSCGLRQHGRTVAVPRRLARTDRPRERTLPARRPRFHRRHEPLRGQAQPASQRARLSVVDRLRPFLASPHDARRAR